MKDTSEKDFEEQSPGVYPPSFCDWRLLLAVMVITEVSVFLVGLGPGGFPGWRWLLTASIYTQWMALFCAAGLCISSGWTRRFSTDGAWVFSWLIVLLLTMLFRACCATTSACSCSRTSSRSAWWRWSSSVTS